MTEDKYYKLSKSLPAKILSEFDVELSDKGEHMELASCEGTHREHVSRLTGILAVMARLFDFALYLSLSLKGGNEGIIAINHVREQTIRLMNNQADTMVEKYLDDEIKTRKQKGSSDGR